MAAELIVDHVTAAGRDLKHMQAALASVGIASENGGPHSAAPTEMVLTSFPDGSYLELIAPRAPGVEKHDWGKYMLEEAGPCAWAVRVKDIAAEVKRLKAAGVKAGDPVRGGRERPDGVRLEWQTAGVGEGPHGSFFPFLIQDITPRSQRAYSKGKPTTRDFSGVTRVVIAVSNLGAAVDRYREAYGIPAPIKQVDTGFGAQIALMGGTPVVLAAPLGSQSWLAGRIERFGEGPCAFVLGARKAGHYKAASTSRWFGADISWFDSAALGWRLGFE